MIAWKRSTRTPSALRRWINIVHAALHQWSQPYWKSIATRFFLPRLRRPRRVLLGIEVLEARITPTTVQFLQATSTVMEFPIANFFRVGLSAASSQTVTVQYTTSDGTAKAGTDYTATSGLSLLK